MATTVPVFINRAPWNELVLRGRRHVKTLSFPWKHRGLILLYTSKSRGDPEGWDIYNLPQGAVVPKGAIVGTAVVTDVVPTNEAPDEWYSEDPHLLGTAGQAYLVRVEDVRRLSTPVAWRPPQGVIRIGKTPLRLALMAPQKARRPLRTNAQRPA